MGKGSKQTSDEMLAPKLCCLKRVPKTIDCYLEKNRNLSTNRLVDQARVIRTYGWLTEVKLEEIKLKKLTRRNGEENQEINDIPVVAERMQNENGPMEPN